MLNKKLTNSMTREKNRLLEKKQQHLDDIEQIDTDIAHLDILIGQLPEQPTPESVPSAE